MGEFVKCGHCIHYIWFSVNDDNSFAVCDLTKECVSANRKVCEKFILGKGIHTKKAIPDYCTYYYNDKK